MELTFLGTSSGIPTKNRSLPSIILKRKREILMFDCGEGTQRQMATAKISFNREMKIFITHMHGDHVLGLPGLIQTMSIFGRNRKLEIFGPKGIRELLLLIGKCVPYNLNFQLNIHEDLKTKIVDESEYEINCIPVRHSITAFAYIFQEKMKPGKFNPQKAIEEGVPEGPLWKEIQMGGTITVDGRTIHPEGIVGPPRRGVKIVFSGDTRPCKMIKDQATGADILIHDSTYDNELKDKASKHKHSTSEEAAKIAKRAGVKKLILTHISAIYDGMGSDRILNQAKNIFPDTILAEDMMSLKV